MSTPAGEPPKTGLPAEEPPVTPPDFLDPRFKSVEEQAKAYKEAEKQMQRANQEAAEARRLAQELQGRMAAPAATPEPPVNTDHLFWEKPSEVIKKIVGEMVSPFVEDRYEMQKTQFRQDPDFVKYEAQIDQMVKMQPELKQKPTVVADLFRTMRAMNFDVNAERERIRQEEIAKLTGKTAAGVEGAGAPPASPGIKVELTDEEKRSARGIYGGNNPEEAYKKYAEAKIKYAARG